MSRKWMVLASSMASVALLVCGFAIAADDEGPLHEIMEKVNKSNTNIKNAVRTQAKFKKANNGKDVASEADKLVGLGKEAKAITDAAKKAKDVPNPVETWNSMMDSFIASAEDVSKAASKGDYTKTKDAQKALTKRCADCHEKFRVEEE